MVHHPGSRPDFGLIGYGRFGAFAARHLALQGTIRVWDLRWNSSPGQARNAEAPPAGVLPSTLEETCRARFVILAVPIGAIPPTLERIHPYLLPRTLVADTASVKVWPCRWLAEGLPAEAELIGTHPLFGPDSAAAGLAGHQIALVPVRLRHRRAVGRFLEAMGLRVRWTTPEEHDRAMAETQSLVHWIGRGLERMGSGPRDLDTMGYRRLLEILEFVVRDSWELFVDLQRWNPYAAGLREKALRVLSELDREVTPGGEP